MMKQRIIPMMILLLNAGCAVGPDYQRPQITTDPSYTAEPLPEQTVAINSQDVQHFVKDLDIPEAWWQVFHCQTVDELVRQGLANNPSLAQAKATLMQAQEAFNAQYGSSTFPTLDANLAVTREKFNFDSFGVTAIPSPPPFTLYNIGMSISYTLDLFGGKRRELEALCAVVHYQRYEFLAAQLSLTANIITTAIHDAVLREKIATTQKILTLDREELAIMQQRLSVGGVSELDVHDKMAKIAATEMNLAPLEKERQITRHQLAIYSGESPGSTSIPEVILSELQLPTLVPVSVASALLRQRPDIQAAEALLHQASANVGVATANLYPSITITGDASSLSTEVDQLFTKASAAWNIGTNLTQPIFHGGALRAQRRQAIAAFDQAQAAYQEAILNAFKNVADSLKALEYDAKNMRANHLSTQQAEQKYHISAVRYQAGGISYLDLLDMQKQFLQAQLSEQQAYADRLSDTAALFQAMGGGWWNHE